MVTVPIFGERLDEVLFEKRISRETFANDLHINLSGVYKYLRKEYLPTTKNAIKISEYLDCPLDYLLGLIDDYPKESYLLPHGNFAEIFAKTLTERGITRYKLGKETNFSDQSISDWYKGKKLPTISNLCILAKYFDCSVDYLLGRVT